MPNVITLSRSKLYELVWSRPVTELASEFGISDVALAKRCRAIRIPLPPRGYWAKVAAGQKPRRPPLPPFVDRRRQAGRRPVPADRLEAGRRERASRDGLAACPPGQAVDSHGTDESNDPTITFDPDRTSTPIDSTPDLPALSIPPTADLASTLPIVRRTARHYRHPRRNELELPRGQATGPILHLEVSDASLERALLVADRFLRAADAQGATPIPPREPDPDRHGYTRSPAPAPTGPKYADLSVDGMRIEFCIEERYESRELPPTAADLAQKKKYPYLRLQKRYEKQWSGHLRLKRASYRYPHHIDGKSWFETANRKLDVLIPKILADFHAVAARLREVEEQRAREERARAEAERLRRERSVRRADNAKFIHELERQAGAWSRAQQLRRYLRAAKRALAPDDCVLTINGHEIDWLDWAAHYVDQLDPLHPTPRDPDLAHERGFRWDADKEHFSDERQRLTGHDWEHSLKLRADADDDEDTSIDDDG